MAWVDAAAYIGVGMVVVLGLGDLLSLWPIGKLLNLASPDGQHLQPAPRRREHIPDKVKMYVWQRDGGRCVECGSNENIEYDHIIPFSKGGSSTERNLQLLCERCNGRKGASLTVPRDE